MSLLNLSFSATADQTGLSIQVILSVVCDSLVSFLCFSALWCEDAIFIKKALVSFMYNAFLN